MATDTLVDGTGSITLPGGTLYYSATCNFDSNTAVFLKCDSATFTNCVTSFGISKVDTSVLLSAADATYFKATNIAIHCTSVPGPGTSSVVVGLAVTLALGGAALCGIWVMRDIKNKKDRIGQPIEGDFYNSLEH